MYKIHHIKWKNYGKCTKLSHIWILFEFSEKYCKCEKFRENIEKTICRQSCSEFISSGKLAAKILSESSYVFLESSSYKLFQVCLCVTFKRVLNYLVWQMKKNWESAPNAALHHVKHWWNLFGRHAAEIKFTTGLQRYAATKWSM